MDFKSLMESIKQTTSGLVNGESSKEFIDTIDRLNQDLDNASKEYEAQTVRLHDMTEAYIKAKKLEGSSETPKQEQTAEDSKPKSLMDIAKEIVNNTEQK